MRAVFMSYRRADSADVSGRIRDHLVADFGEEAIFKDVISIPPGEDFQSYINQQIAQCEVFLPIIGRYWLSMTNNQGQRRLEDPRDLVRREIESALELAIPIIPLLVMGAEMPGEEDLPESLAKLASLNAHTVRPDPDFQQDMLSLSNGIKKHLDWLMRHRLGALLRIKHWARRIAGILPSRSTVQRGGRMLLACLLVGAGGGWVLDHINDYDGDYLLLGVILSILFYVYFLLLTRLAQR